MERGENQQISFYKQIYIKLKISQRTLFQEPPPTPHVIGWSLPLCPLWVACVSDVQVDDGFWEGELDGRVGVFPSLVVELLSEDREEEEEEEEEEEVEEVAVIQHALKLIMMSFICHFSARYVAMVWIELKFVYFGHATPTSKSTI